MRIPVRLRILIEAAAFNDRVAEGLGHGRLSQVALNHVGVNHHPVQSRRFPVPTRMQKVNIGLAGATGRMEMLQAPASLPSDLPAAIMLLVMIAGPGNVGPVDHRWIGWTRRPLLV